MNDAASNRATAGTWIPRVAILALAAYLAGPTLAEAWSHDLYSRGGALAFAVSVAGVLAGFLIAGKARCQSMAWPVLAVLCCAAGSMSDLRVLHHAGLACALAGWAGAAPAGLTAAAAALAWMPAAGWFLSRFHAGGLAGWERPLAATAGATVLLVIAKSTRPSPI